MGKVTPHAPVKLIVGLLAGKEELLNRAAEHLEALYGPIDYRSPILPFTYTDYYCREMGPNLLRQFLSFARLIAPEDLVQIKLQTNALEMEFAPEGRRQVNLDPGYLCAGKLVLATTKDQQHRLYLGQGIYAEVTLRYRHGSFQPWEWTYPDYRSPEYLEIFHHIRNLYMKGRR